MKRINILLFAAFGTLMTALHFVQCYFRIKAHLAFLVLLSSNSQSTAKEEGWIQFSNLGVYVELIYYFTGVLFILLFGYRFVSGKIRLHSLIIGTLSIYLFTFLLVLPLEISQSDVSNLLLPIFMSFFLAFLFILWAFLKKHRLLRSSRRV